MATLMQGVESIELWSVPPSLNRQGRGGSQGRASVMKQRRLKESLQNDLWALLRASGLPRGCEHVSAKARLRFPVRRTRDEGNFSWLLDKALADALVYGGYLTDDNPAYYRFEALEFDPEPGPARTLVILSYRREEG